MVVDPGDEILSRISMPPGDAPRPFVVFAPVDAIDPDHLMETLSNQDRFAINGIRRQGPKVTANNSLRLAKEGTLGIVKLEIGRAHV